MTNEFVKQIDCFYRIGETRVSLDSLAYLFREWISAEGMVESYPSVTLRQVQDALAFYLANRAEIDANLLEAQHIAAEDHKLSKRNNADLIDRLRRAREETQVPG